MLTWVWRKRWFNVCSVESHQLRIGHRIHVRRLSWWEWNTR
ncbi:hypothetical protein [Nocardiopsis dassonvillei]|nr:hypothetical protein [Nocardiopsis dassonvillei]